MVGRLGRSGFMQSEKCGGSPAGIYLCAQVWASRYAREWPTFPCLVLTWCGENFDSKSSLFIGGLLLLLVGFGLAVGWDLTFL